MLATDARSAASTWRPQEFGAKRVADIKDPLVEPLWNGLRVLAFVTGGEARFIDVYGTMSRTTRTSRPSWPPRPPRRRS
jgi:hypothetical protein